MRDDISIKIGADTSGFQRAVRQASQSSEQLERAMKGVGDSSDKASSGADRAGNSVEDFGRDAKRAESSAGAFGGSLVKMAASFSLVDRGIDVVIGGLQRIGQAFTGTIASGVRLNMEMEGITARLTNMFGSAQQATVVLAEFQKVASTTHFSLGEVSQAGATLTAFLGENRAAVTGLIKPVADLAAFMKIPVVEAAEAFGRAMAGGAGAADILRDKGILPLVEAFKGIDDVTKISAPAFKKALIETMIDPLAGIAGATDRMSATTEGAISNMTDAWGRFKTTLTDGLMPAIDEIARGITDSLNRVIEGMTGTKGELQSFGEAVVAMFRSIQPAMESFLLGLTEIGQRWRAAQAPNEVIRSAFLTSGRTFIDQPDAFQLTRMSLLAGGDPALRKAILEQFAWNERMQQISISGGIAVPLPTLPAPSGAATPATSIADLFGGGAGPTAPGARGVGGAPVPLFGSRALTIAKAAAGAGGEQIGILLTQDFLGGLLRGARSVETDMGRRLLEVGTAAGQRFAIGVARGRAALAATTAEAYAGAQEIGLARDDERGREAEAEAQAALNRAMSQAQTVGDMPAAIGTIKRINANIAEQHKVLDDSNTDWREWAKVANTALQSVAQRSDATGVQILASISNIGVAFATGGWVGAAITIIAELINWFDRLGAKVREVADQISGAMGSLAAAIIEGFKKGLDPKVIGGQLDAMVREIVARMVITRWLGEALEGPIDRLAKAMVDVENGVPGSVERRNDALNELNALMPSAAQGGMVIAQRLGVSTDAGEEIRAMQARGATGAQIEAFRRSGAATATTGAGASTAVGGLSFSNISGASRDLLMNAFGGFQDTLIAIRDILQSMRDGGMSLAAPGAGGGGFTVQGDYVVNVQQVADAANVEQLDRALGDVMRNAKRRRGLR